MGFWGDAKDWLLGGTSKKPEEFRQQYAHQGQIDEAIRRGLATNNVAPQASMGGQFRDAQLGQLGQLQRIAAGQDKGAGELAVQRQAQNALASQQAAARMARGPAATMAARNAANASAAIGLSATGQAQEAAARDQQAAQGLLTQAASAGRGQDQAIQIANMDAQLKAMGMNDQTRLAYLAQLTQMDANQLAQQMAAYNQAASKQGALGSIRSAAGGIVAGGLAPGGIFRSGPAPASGAPAAAAPQMLGTPSIYANNPAAGLNPQLTGMVSDERLKTDIKDAGDDIDEMLDRLVAKRYRYKDPAKHGEGERFGFMAQDAERSAAGASFVTDGPDGKRIDVTKAVGAALAATARLNERLRAIEEREDEDEHEGMGKMGPPAGIMIVRRAMGAA